MIESRKAFMVGLSSGVLCTVLIVSFLQTDNASSISGGIPQPMTAFDVAAGPSSEHKSGSEKQTHVQNHDPSLPRNGFNKINPSTGGRDGYSPRSGGKKKPEQGSREVSSKKEMRPDPTTNLREGMRRIDLEKISTKRQETATKRSGNEKNGKNTGSRESAVKAGKGDAEVGRTRDARSNLTNQAVPDTTDRRGGKYYSPITYDDLHQVPILTMPENGRIQCPSDLDSPQARALGCRHRLPNVIGIGVEKCGTAAMSFFLEAHPSIAHAKPRETYFWSRHMYRGLGWYMHRMPVSSKYQVTMEKTPNYFKVPSVPTDIKRFMPADTKFILAFRDPYARAVSHYLHLKLKVKRPEHFVDRPLGLNERMRCFVNDTFESSVIRPDGSTMDYNCVLKHGLYHEGLQLWLDVFPRENFYFIDGDQFQRNPLPILKEIETFLGLPKYFDESHIYFDEEKGFYCKSGYNKPCLGGSKGRSHPDVDKDVEDTIRNFFRPHKRELEELTGRTFSWE